MLARSTGSGGLSTFSKILCAFGILLGVLLLLIVGIIIKVDPPPLRLRDADKAVLSVETWAIKVDRSANMVCYQQPGQVRAGLADAYCGPKIVHENANQLVAIEDRAFDIVRAIYFDKKKYTLMMTELLAGMVQRTCRARLLCAPTYDQHHQRRNCAREASCSPR